MMKWAGFIRALGKMASGMVRRICGIRILGVPVDTRLHLGVSLCAGGRLTGLGEREVGRVCRAGIGAVAGNGGVTCPTHLEDWDVGIGSQGRLNRIWLPATWMCQRDPGYALDPCWLHVEMLKKWHGGGICKAWISAWNPILRRRASVSVEMRL